MRQLDIVYFVKDTKQNDELIYSVRSVVKNFPHQKIWFAGGCPDGIRPDGRLRVKQDNGKKYANVRRLTEAVVNCDDITEDFWLFNDDFFIMSRVADVQPVVRGSLWRTIQYITNKNKSQSEYVKMLKRTAQALKELHRDRLNYCAHLPMLINRTKAKEVLRIFNGDISFRSAYGNYWEIGGVIQPDVKITDAEQLPDPDIHNMYISTNDKSFRNGIVGEIIRKAFTEPSKYEATPSADWTKAELIEYATANNINVNTRGTKAQILERINA